MSDDLDLFDDENDRPVGGPKSGIVVVSVANFLVGLLLIVGGLLMTLRGMSFSADTLNEIAGSGSLDQAAQAAAGRLVDTVRAVMAALATVALIFGGLCLAAGLGVVYRQDWGRILSLVLGFGAGLLAMLGLLLVDFAGLIVYGGYALVMLLILFDKDYSRQFR